MPQPTPFAAAGNTLQLQLAGSPRLQRAAQTLTPGTRKALALLVLLVLEPGLRRGRAAELLWPEADPVAARRNLRRDLFRLRQLGVEVGEGSGDTLAPLTLALAWPAATPLPPRWLDGLDEVAGSDLAHWVEQQRAVLQGRWIEHLCSHARALEEQARTQGDPPTADAAWAAWGAVLADGAAGPGHAEARAALQRLHAGRAGTPAAEAAAPGPDAASPTLGAVAFVGRQAEVRALEQALQQGQVVLIAGSPGVGKTRLAHEVLAGRGGVLVLRCRPEDAALPYASALRGLQLLQEAAPDVTLPAWVQRALATLRPVVSAAGATDPPPIAGLHQAYQAALRQLAEGNFGGLLIDDWQWADEASLALWEPLPEPLPERPPQTAPAVSCEPVPTRLPCLVVHRSGELPPGLLLRRRRWLDEGRAIALHLGPLAAGDARTLLRSAGTLDTGTEQRLLDQGAGNPLFLLETLRHLRRHGTVQWPDGVQGLVLARVRALGAPVRQVLEAASLAGDDLQPARLAAATGLDALGVAQALEHAVAAELLVADSRGRHHFAHDLMQQAVAQSLSAVRRQALHGALAAELQRGAAEPARIAHHLDEADRRPEAAAWHLRAAEAAVQQHAWPQALQAADAVLAASTQAPQRLEAHRLRARALRRQADPRAAEAELATALAEAVRTGPEQVITLGLDRAELLSSLGRAHEALAELQTLAADPALSPAQRRRLLHEHANALGFLGRHAEASARLNELLATLPASAPAERQRVLQLLARSTYWAGELDASQRLVQQTLELARQLGDDAVLASSWYRLGVLDREQGRTEAALQQLQQAADAARRIGHIELLRSALSTMATVRLDRLQLAEAEALIVAGEQAAPFWDTPDLEDVFDERRFRLHQLRGEVEAAWRVCRRSLARNRAMHHLHSHLAALLQAVGLALLTDDVAQARRLFDEAHTLHTTSGGDDSLQAHEMAAHEVPLLQAEGRAAAALRRADHWLAQPQTRRVDDHGRVLLAAAEAALDRGQATRAAGLLDQASRLPDLALPLQALLLAVRLRCAASAGGQQADAANAVTSAATAELHAARRAAAAWLQQPVLPVLEAARLRRVLAALGAGG
ncbi:ATP-binding protein [Pseudorhodoferax sp.]|uniref:ATP-binding protein n=1 Tax=Pseudorhodoferax sp. TaxID=1993553 RepID=UPI002DD6432A|nr:AAA family ATPase [Pseudorhodoferax sp.]